MSPPIDFVASEARHVLVLCNLTAGSCSRTGLMEQVGAALAERGLASTCMTSLDELSERAKELAATGDLRAVVAAGGDGTAAAVVNGTPVGTPVAVFPLGTENLLARYLKVGRDAGAFAAMIGRGQTVWLDAGEANGRLFLLMASAGFDAEVVRRLHEARRGHIRHLTYAKPIWETIRKYNYPPLRVSCETEPGKWGASRTARWTFAFNLPCYGGGLKIAPDADGADGLVNVCTFRRGGLARGLWYLAAVVAGRHRRLADCTMERCGRLRIESDEPVPYQIDGDPGGMLPVAIETLPGRLRVVVSAGWLNARGLATGQTAI